MARPNKIWWWKQKKAWYVTIDGKRHRLSEDKPEAEKLFHKLKAQEIKPTSSVTAAEVMDKFLVWNENHRAKRTADWYREHLQSFLDSLTNQSIEAAKIRPHHVTDWCKSHWSKSTTRGAMVTVQRCFKWAVRQGYLDSSPLEYLEKPSAERRDNCPTQADYDEILKLSTEPFKSVLEFVYETGCRPQEVVAIEPRHVKGDRIEFPVVESKGKKVKRIIYLTDKAKQILDRNGGQFINARGRQWTCFALDCRLKKIAKKTGKKFCMTDMRHFWATRLLESGLDHITVAKLMGHADASMISRVYSHIGEKNNFLLERLNSVGASQSSKPQSQSD